MIVQLWFSISFLCDGFADVGTMLGSRLLGLGDEVGLAALSRRLSVCGLTVGMSMSAMLWFGRHSIAQLFTHDLAVQTTLEELWPIVTAVRKSSLCCLKL